MFQLIQCDISFRYFVCWLLLLLNSVNLFPSLSALFLLTSISGRAGGGCNDGGVCVLRWIAMNSFYYYFIVCYIENICALIQIFKSKFFPPIDSVQDKFDIRAFMIVVYISLFVLQCLMPYDIPCISSIIFMHIVCCYYDDSQLCCLCHAPRQPQ